MKTKNLPAKLLLLVGGIAALGAMCSGGALPFAATIGEWSPGAQVEADAAEAAIEPALYPTVRYNEEVLPELQDIERDEIAETTRNKQAAQRNVDKAQGVASIAMTGAFAFGVVLASAGVGVGIGGMAGARGVRAMREARLPMTRQLTEGPHVTEYGTLIHTVTGAVVALDAPQDARLDHGHLIAGSYATTPAGMLGQILEIQREMQRDGEQRRLTE